MAKRKITQLDLFSGIGGFHLGFERAGYEVESYFSEIDKHAVAVYKHRFKNSTYVGSVTDVRGAELPRIDLITFGSPCQDFSLAGKRKGLSGDRSGLVTEAIRLIGECQPSVFIWENVKGTFSSNAGADFWAILQAFANIGGYRFEWELLNTSRILPQNRERVYLVGYSTTPGGDWRGVFPIGEETGNFKRTQPTQGSRALMPTICSAYSKIPTDGRYLKVKSATSKGYEVATEGDSINLSQPNSETRRGRVGKGKAQTLETSCNQAVVEPVAMKWERTEEGKRKRKENRDKKGKDYTSFQDRKLTPSDKPISNTITSFVEKDAMIAVVEPTTCRGGLQKNAAHFEEKSPALTSAMGMGGGHTPIVDQPNYRIRRLTPIECERLQGFPDNHTEYGNYDGEVKKMSNTQRYKQCGNAVTVDIVALVAEAVKPLFK